MNILEINGLNVSFTTEDGDLHALRDVSFSVPEKSIVGVVGGEVFERPGGTIGCLPLLGPHGRRPRRIASPDDA